MSEKERERASDSEARAVVMGPYEEYDAVIWGHLIQFNTTFIFFYDVRIRHNNKHVKLE